MKVFVQGQSGSIDLQQQHLVGAGGEGVVYAIGGVAYKVYNDPRRMIPLGKIAELAAISNSHIIKPEKVLVDPKGSPLGYTMGFVKGGQPLVRLFTRAYREREGLQPDDMIRLMRTMQTEIADVHGAGVLVVDCNEMNWLVSSDHQEVYGIDADSYQTRSFPATAIMPSVKDWSVQNNDFTTLSDWFSFAILAFQMLVGIHPFKGTYPGCKGFEDRQKARISVLHNGVGVPKGIYPFSVIPPVYLAWFEALFEQGKRLPPPADLIGTIPVQVVARIIQAGNCLRIGDLHDFGHRIRGFIQHCGALVVMTEEGLYWNNHRVCDTRAVHAIGFSPRMLIPIAADLRHERLYLFNLSTRSEISLGLRVDQAMGSDGRIYVKSGEGIHEVILDELGGRIVPSTHLVASTLEHAGRLYEGVLLQKLLNGAWATVFPESRKAYPTRVRELDAYTPLEARFDRGVLVVIGRRKDGKYDRLVLRFAEDYGSYDVRVVEDVALAAPNFVVLDKGVVVLLTEDEKLELFAKTKGASAIKEIDDPAIGADLQLRRYDGGLAFARASKVHSLAMK